ncbi:uncharacterized protein LOC106137743 [Amyelois transitella]|uniref:uncharacterized protein LOC106137743 n=1 Tax=Amyelois transitella TaxID=680683 RepID=UPI00298F5E40|nr:uncharacterized protein LOC106137743 [Amyelois transitella]
MSLVNDEAKPKSRDRSPYSRPPTAFCDKDSEKLTDLVKGRGIIKGRLTRLTTFINSITRDQLNSQKCIDLKLRMQGAASLLTEFNNIQTMIEKIVIDSDLDCQLNQRDLFEDSYYSALSRAEYLLNRAEVSDGSSVCHSKIKSIKLPVISMPTFDGSYEHWLEFRDTFMSLVHNSNEISDIQKFHYLKSSLKGSAELVIDSVEFSASNYTIAWELLLNRYNNSSMLIHNHVKALFTIQKLTKESYHMLRRLIDTILKNLRALKMLGGPTEHWDTLVIFIVTSKLDETTEREWEQYKCTIRKHNETKSSLKVDDLLTFLRDRAEMLETLQASHSKINLDSKKQTTHKAQCNVSTKSQQSRTTYKKPCLMCYNDHALYSCPKFLDANIDTKLHFIATNKLCENCLRSGHTLETCKFGPCRKCNRKHNTLIHSDTSNDAQVMTLHSNCNNREPRDVPTAPATPAVPAVDVPMHRSSTAQVNKPHIDNTRYTFNNQSVKSINSVLLSTAMIEIADNHNNYHIARCLLDSGSQLCFLSKDLCTKLNVTLIQSTCEIRGIGNSVTNSTQICDVKIRSRTGAYSTSLKCFVLPYISCTLPAVAYDQNELFIPEHIQLADPLFYESHNIDILIGAEIFWDLLCEGKIRLPNGPVLQNTKLGWIISGPIHSNTHNIDRSFQCNFSHAIETQLRQFWELEELPKASLTHTDDERACEEHFINTTTRTSDGRFCVHLPLQKSPASLGESYTQAKIRFLVLERRLERNITYKKLYTDFIHEYLDLGHMKKVSSYGTPHYFLPHHGVYREHSSSTRLRVVFDGSAATSNGVSLNDIQLVGPPLQSELFDILLRFRRYRFTACADIQKMYRQCLLHESQRDMQLIVWRDNPSEPLSMYQLNTVTYGMAASPYLAVRCLKQLALECTDPDVKRIISEDFYVDDMITGWDDKHELLSFCNKTSKCLQSGCFPLRKWTFNFQCDQSSGPFSAGKELTLGDTVQCKTLGLGWYNTSDEFYFNTQFKSDTNKITKRSILSHISQIFDPLGLVSPIIIIVKILLQRLWLLQLGWDDVVPSDVLLTWTKFANALSELNTIRVPRHVINTTATHSELHIFTDASQVAYGACIYVRSVSSDNNSLVRLLCSKSKVAPLKPVSIPRLELCGALLGARLYDKVNKALHLQFKNIIFWTDSTIVLGWLHMPPNLQKTFVQNRTSEIHELTRELPWRHVSGKNNPADLVSRGMSLEDLSTSTLWWEGPAYLRQPDFRCDLVPSFINGLPDELPELKSGVTLSAVPDKVSESSLFPFYRFSQFNRMRRAVAYVNRFIYNSRNTNNPRSGVLCVDELRESDITLARLSQLESFPVEYMSLTKNNCLGHKHNLAKLSLFIDHNKLIRVGGRISNSQIFSLDKKHPILISGSHPFATLLFRYEHTRLLHAAPQALLYNLRETWWPISGRNLARKVVHNCIVCKRLRGKTPTPLMGNLPMERLDATFPFMRCGVDYAGPMLMLNRRGKGSRTTKCYICIFICFVTRAIHLELVSDLSTEGYLLALKRFISRRGKPLEIFSDNGRNFVGLMNEFKKFINNCSSEIIDYAISQNIKFTFLPPYSPNFGGLWEAGVKSCKYHLRRVVGNAHLTFEEFSTVLVQIEAVLNSRPLSPMSTDPQDFTPLSPAHFLLGRPLTAPACEDVTEISTNRLTRYQRVEQIRQHFWSRWAKEYVSELQARTKRTKDDTPLKPGMLVVIKDDNLPPLKWHLGRIIDIFPGKDGVARVADIRTSTGIVKRSYSKICPLLE